MASSTRGAATRIIGSYGAPLETMSRRMLGRVTEAATVMWHHPAVFEDMVTFGRKVDSWNRLDPGQSPSRPWPRPA